MIAVYAETSAIAAALFDADAASRRALDDDGQLLFTSELTLVELERYLVRAVAEGHGVAPAVRRRLDQLQRRLQLLPIDAQVLARAKQPFLVEPVRSLDALHLATVLNLVEHLRWCRVLTTDRRIRDNAEAYGLDPLPG